MRRQTQATVIAVRAHVEHGAIVRALTPDDGVQPGYVRGGHSRRLRPILVPGNVIQAEYRARTEDQLAQLSVELVHSRAPFLDAVLSALSINWASALTPTTLPAGEASPRLYEALHGVLSHDEPSPNATGNAATRGGNVDARG